MAAQDDDFAIKSQTMTPQEKVVKAELKFLADLNDAHTFAQKALDALYEPDGPKRPFWYRRRLGNAQSALIGLYVRDLNKNREGT